MNFRLATLQLRMGMSISAATNVSDYKVSIIAILTWQPWDRIH